MTKGCSGAAGGPHLWRRRNDVARRINLAKAEGIIYFMGKSLPDAYWILGGTGIVAGHEKERILIRCAQINRCLDGGCRQSIKGGDIFISCESRIVTAVKGESAYQCGRRPRPLRVRLGFWDPSEHCTSRPFLISRRNISFVRKYR